MEPKFSSWANQASRLELPHPLRMLVIGATTTGKTYLLYMMILHGDFGSKAELTVIVYSPVPASLQQNVWKSLRSKGWNLTTLNDLPDNIPTPPGRRVLLIIDDVDNLRLASAGKRPKGVLPVSDRVDRLFCVESHQSNLSIIMVSHKLNIGAVGARDSAEYVVLTANRETSLLKICKSLDISPADTSAIANHLIRPVPATGLKTFETRFYNHMIVCQRPGFPALWQACTNVFTPPGVTPFAN